MYFNKNNELTKTYASVKQYVEDLQKKKILKFEMSWTFEYFHNDLFQNNS